MNARRLLTRITIALLGLAAAGVTVLVLLGGGREVIAIDRTRDFARPPAHVFRFLSEPALVTQWVGGLVELTPLDTDWPRPGAKARQVMTRDGRRWEMTATLLEYEPPRRVAFRFEMPGTFTNDVIYTLSEVGGQTRVDVHSEARFFSFFTRLLSPLVISDVQKKMQSDFTHLQELVERDPPLQPKPAGRPAFRGCCAPEPTKP